jgi:hypothetical protein
MTELPDPTTPLYAHPLPTLECWLKEIGAVQQRGNICRWDLHLSDWSAELELETEELTVRWHQDGSRTVRQFPYGLSRADVEAAIMLGP